MPSNYWNDRNIRTQTRLQNKSVAEIEKEQARLYKKAMKQTIKDFESTYNKYLLQLAEGQEPSPALMYNMDKYWQMQADLRERCKELGDTEVELYSKRFEEYYQDIYDSTVLPSADSFHTISTGNAEQVVNQIWCADGKSWSSRVWNNQSYLQQTLNNQLINCVTTGANPARLTKLLTERFNVARHRANTLVRTEMAHITTQAAKNRYLDYGIEEYEILGREEEDIGCECKELDGKIFAFNDPNAPLPPFHVNCRCAIAPVVPDEVETPVEEEAPMVEQFVPATTKQEAEQYALAFSNNVSYKGISLENANKINKRLEELTRKYPINKLETIESGTKGAMSANYRHLTVNSKKIGKTLDNDYKVFLENQKQTKETVQIIRERFNGKKMPYSMQHEVDKLENSLKFTRWSICDFYDDKVSVTVTHEYGHIIADQYFGQINGKSANPHISTNWSIKGQSERITNIFNQAIQNGDIHSISQYGATNPKEFFAETFTMREMGEQLPDYIETAILEVLTNGIL